MNDEPQTRNVLSESETPREPDQLVPARTRQTETTGTQFVRLCKCVGYSVPLTYGAVCLLSFVTGEKFFWFNVCASLVVCPLGVAFHLLWRVPMPPRTRIVNAVGLAFLSACTAFLVVWGAAMIWVMFFFAS